MDKLYSIAEINREIEGFAVWPEDVDPPKDYYALKQLAEVMRENERKRDLLDLASLWLSKDTPSNVSEAIKAGASHSNKDSDNAQ